MQKYDYENNIGFIVNRTARAFVKTFDTELRNKVGITFGQWKVIITLINQNGLTQKEIADKLGLEGPTLIPIIDKMEKEGLVIRKIDANDRRNNRIYHTEKANALWDKMLECALKIRQIAVKDIPEQSIAIMRDVLDKIWLNLRTEYDDVDCTVVDNNSNNIVIAKGSTVNTSENTAVATTATRINQKN
ncbi:MAG TPA: MarR family winged helix-turn-helix transcriptional regulator [Nitrososphaeraceae archaeon]|jgi:MarR family transcriptional regulator for hemolysin